MAKNFLKSLKNKFCRVEHTHRQTHTHIQLYIYRLDKEKYLTFMGTCLIYLSKIVYNPIKHWMHCQRGSNRESLSYFSKIFKETVPKV